MGELFSNLGFLLSKAQYSSDIRMALQKLLVDMYCENLKSSGKYLLGFLTFIVLPNIKTIEEIKI